MGQSLLQAVAKMGFLRGRAFSLLWTDFVFPLPRLEPLVCRI